MWITSAFELSETTDIEVRSVAVTELSISRELLDADGNTVTERTALEAGTYYIKITAIRHHHRRLRPFSCLPIRATTDF